MSGKSNINKPVLLRLLITIAGYSLLVAGVYVLYPPAALLTAGILLTVEAWT